MYVANPVFIAMGITPLPLSIPNATKALLVKAIGNAAEIPPADVCKLSLLYNHCLSPNGDPLGVAVSFIIVPYV